MNAFLTTTLVNTKDATQALKEAALRNSAEILVSGAWIGADACAPDEAVSAEATRKRVGV